MLPQLEKEIEKEVLTWLNLQYGCKAWKNKSMGTFDPAKGVYRTQGGAFSEKGSSDILGIYRGRFLALEVKSRRGTLRPEQKLFLDEMRRLGAIAGVVRSLQDAIDLLQGSCGKENEPAEIALQSEAASPCIHGSHTECGRCRIARLRSPSSG